MRFATITLSILMSTALAGSALAGGGRFLESLDLTEDQQEVLASFKDEMQAAREEVKESSEALRDAVKADAEDGDIDVRSLKKLVDAKVEAQRDLAYLRLEHLSELADILTPEQLAELQEMREERKERRGEHPGRGYGPPRGEGERGSPRWEKSGGPDGGASGGGRR
jgi:Spy/CpxP family protein refolding chaperone